MLLIPHARTTQLSTAAESTHVSLNVHVHLQHELQLQPHPMDGASLDCFTQVAPFKAAKRPPGFPMQIITTRSLSKAIRESKHGTRNGQNKWQYYLWIVSIVRVSSGFTSVQTKDSDIYTPRLNTGISSGDAVSPSASCLVGLLELMAWYSLKVVKCRLLVRKQRVAPLLITIQNKCRFRNYYYAQSTKKYSWF